MHRRHAGREGRIVLGEDRHGQPGRDELRPNGSRHATGLALAFDDGHDTVGQNWRAGHGVQALVCVSELATRGTVRRR